MKKYSSYANLKIGPSPISTKLMGYEYWPSTKITSNTPITRKGTQIPLMMISKQPYMIPITTVNANSSTNNNNSNYSNSNKYSAGFLQKQKLFSSKKQNKDSNNVHVNSGNNNSSKYGIVNCNNDAYFNSNPNKYVNINKPNSSKSKRNANCEEKQKSLKKQKNMKLLQIQNKQNLMMLSKPITRYDVQSPKGFVNKTKQQKQKQKSKPKIQPQSQLHEKQKLQIVQRQQATKQKQKKEKQQDKLQQYVTKYQPQQKSMLLHCTSDSNLIKQINLQQRKPLKGYYRSALYNAFFSSKLSSFNQICRNHLATSIQFLSYARRNKQMMSQNNIANKTVSLPSTSRKTLVFDLDETLIHCNESLDLPHDVALQITFPNNSKIKAGINVRPYAVECLKQLSKHFQIIIFTASHQCYANVIVDYLDPKKQYISHRFFRETCFKTEQGFYVKDLRVFGKDRDLANLLLIDNAAYSYCFQPENGVPIIPFYNNKADLQLKQVTNYLKQFAQSRNMRNRNQNYMKLSEYYRYSCPKQLINQLYY